MTDNRGIPPNTLSGHLVPPENVGGSSKHRQEFMRELVMNAARNPSNDFAMDKANRVCSWGYRCYQRIYGGVDDDAGT